MRRIIIINTNMRNKEEKKKKTIRVLDASCRRTGGVQLVDENAVRTIALYAWKWAQTFRTVLYSTGGVWHWSGRSRSAVWWSELQTFLCLLLCSCTCFFMVVFKTDLVWSFILSMMCVSLVPCCGYYSAKQRQRLTHCVLGMQLPWRGLLSLPHIALYRC